MTIEPRAIQDALDQGVRWLARTQDEDGSWHGDYGGPMFLLPLYIATSKIIGRPILEEQRFKMEAYLRAHQNEDGGFGLHVEGASCVYGTTVNYVALRLLGVSAGDPVAKRARYYLHERGGVSGSASWGKFFLALLDLYPYEALNPVPPELWLLPESLPIHPSRLWCHCRMVYLPMSYLYAKRAKWDDTEFILELRRELYPQDWKKIDWTKARTHVAPEDNLSPQSILSKSVHRLLRAAEGLYPNALREQAIDFVLHQIGREDQNTNYICIGPINKLLNTLTWYFEDPDGPELEAHLARLEDYLYEGEDGIRMQGYNSSRLWDTTFAVQALTIGALPPVSRRSLEKAHRYIEQNQVREDVVDRASAYRHQSKGGWPFSDRPHGWPISDCTAEGIKASLALEPLVERPLSKERLQDAVELILSMQNEDGGWATYELQRAPAWLELLNPSDCFREIMIDYSYVECTSACVQALVAFRNRFGHEIPEGIGRAVDRGREFLLHSQRADGSFEGSWGVCFTYGTWFGVKGLRAAGLQEHDDAIRRAQSYLLAKQNRDGGWGESVENCNTRVYNDQTPSQVVMTSWAVLTLLDTGERAERSIERGVEFLLSRQLDSGEYPNEKISGVFNKTCAITYDNYLKIFPVWALAEFLKKSHSASNRVLSAAE